ncbi:putative E3 ubiquitin-protein ligase RF298 [Herrania umbratica]|uniref:E3 ubiquitin-protein ligase RF298 n=1 Tax=Herrania umbratica TaxID=108875 RepID=A0A6J1A2I9_9ROSI|nr:putative E3 ubiquitin-protein ligase RF298 [Herrania umbratica]XP_021281193.1 putative E3 ubiquitin-protein ligase RF298 [Herrania umbratica]
MDEKTDSGGGGAAAASKLGSSSVVPQDKGSKNKRKLDDPSLENPVHVPLSKTEFPLYELPPEIFRGPVLGPLEASSSRVPLREDFEHSDWDDPIACQLEELLLSNLRTIFQTAIKRIIECGYKEDIAEKAISRHGLYQGGKDLVSNVVNDALASLKKGEEGDISSNVFEDLQQLVGYTMLEMIGVLREVKPSLSIAEAMWWLLMCDLNISVACEVEGDIFHYFGCTEVSRENSSDSNPLSRSETQHPETFLPSPSKPNVSKPSFPCSQNYLPETLKFGSFPNSPNPENPLTYEGLTPEKECLVSVGASGDYVPLTSVSEEKPGTGRKGRSKKELAALRQKSFNMEKYRSYGKGAFRAGKLATIGGFVVEKRMKSPSKSPAVNMKNASSKINAEAGDLADESHHVLTNSSPGLILTDKSPTLPTRSTKYAVPTADTELASSSSSLERKPFPKSEGRTSVSSKTLEHDAEKKPASKAEGSTSMSSKTPDYYAGIPYDQSLGKHIPQDEKDELILKLVPRVQELQNELHSWTQWTNQKVMQAARRLSKEQPELKALRQEKEEAEQLQKEKQTMEENTVKRVAEMEGALNDATTQVEDANSTVQKLEMEHSMLKKEMEVAKLQVVESAASCQEAFEREQKALKDVRSWDGQRSLLQEELALEKQMAAELQKKVGKAKNVYNQTEMRWKQERLAKEKFLAQAASIRMEREGLEAAAKVEEDKIKQKAEKDVHKYEEEIKELENKLSELKMKLDSSKIALLRRGSDGGNGQCSSVNERNQVPSFFERVVDIKDYSGSRGLKQERECVMCLSEEKIVVFLPCAHQVLCVKCNELHEKQGMKDCPACRTLIDWRICARFAKP